MKVLWMKRIYEDSDLEMFTRWRHVLTQSFGIEEENSLWNPLYQKNSVKKGDMFLLCSDGLSEFVNCHNTKQVLNGKKFWKTKERHC